jgi:hypothetical protein
MKRPQRELSIGVWVDFGRILAPKPVAGVLGFTVLNGNRERRKDPLEQSVSFIRGVWDIFEEIWARRNGILHSKHSKLLERTDVSATSRLMEFWRGYNVMLRSCDRFIISHHSPADVIRWPMTRKKAVLAQLEKPTIYMWRNSNWKLPVTAISGVIL